MKKIFLVINLLAINFLFSQDTAQVKLIIQNDNNNPIEGEQIVFEAQSGNFHATAISNTNGEATIKLLGNETYNIIIKRIGETEKYNTLNIPALGPNEYYGEQELTLTIFEPKQFTLNNVLFDSGKSTLKNEAQQELEDLFQYLHYKPTVRILIVGHTDNVGDEKLNLELSKERALSVKNYLVKKGIDADRLETDGKGEDEPVASNETAQGKQLNRRTEIILL